RVCRSPTGPAVTRATFEQRRHLSVELQAGHRQAGSLACRSGDQWRISVGSVDPEAARCCVADVSSKTRRSFLSQFKFVPTKHSFLLPRAEGLYDPRFEHDACGVGFVARLSGQPGHDIVAKAVEAVANLSHRGAVAADGKSGDGSGVLTQLPRRLFARELARQGTRLEDTDLFGIGMVFLPSDDTGGQSNRLIKTA